MPEPQGTRIATAWAMPWEEAASTLDVDVSQGLSEVDVVQRRNRYGSNELRKHPRRSSWSILVAQFKSLVIVLLAAAAAVALAFGDTIEAGAVGVVILINTAIGFFTERQAVRSMEALQSLGRVTTRVRRSGQVREIRAEELVPGDIVEIDGGDIVTADLRIVEASKLQADESALTGESLPVGKQTAPTPPGAPLAERTSMLHKGTSVTRGSGSGLVVATGMQTELGEISALVAEAHDEATPLEKRLDQLGRRLIWVTLAITAAVVASGMLAGKDLVLMIETGIALAVAAIPEGLPIVATIALARGMRRMAERNALINRLSSVETLGATSVICTDKTGTLTENRMTLARVELDSGPVIVGPERTPAAYGRDGATFDPLADPLLRNALETGMLCNNASLHPTGETATSPGVGDPLELALLVAGSKAGLSGAELALAYPEVREEAFDSDVKMMATFHESDGVYRVAVKGAPEPVLAASLHTMTASGSRKLTDADRTLWTERNEALAAEGLRVLALASKTMADSQAAPYEQLTFIGLVGLLDPPRPEVRESIEQCRRAGIDIVLVTGDQAVTARRIGREVGLLADDDGVVQGAEMKSPQQWNDVDRQRILNAHLFARVSPRQKLDLIELHQRAGHIVAMTGDGVNDAPALKKADIGVAMGLRGTQVAQEAADMVLQDDRFSTIVTAVREGRAIFENIRTFVFYLMSCNVGEVMVVGLASLLGGTLPILPLQILFLNLVTDVFPALALGAGTGEKDLMERKPRDPNEPILGRRHWLRIALYGVVFTASVLGALVLAESWLEMDTGQAVTVSFLTLAFAQLWHVFNMRAPESGTFRNEITRNPYVWAAIVLCTGLILLAVNVPILAEVLAIHPLGRSGWGLVLGMSLLPLVFGQIRLQWDRRGSKTRDPSAKLRQ